MYIFFPNCKAETRTLMLLGHEYFLVMCNQWSVKFVVVTIGALFLARGQLLLLSKSNSLCFNLDLKHTKNLKHKR